MDENFMKKAAENNKVHWIKSFAWLIAGGLCICAAVYKGFEAGIDAGIMSVINNKDS